jgi:hypothetical protein
MRLRVEAGHRGIILNPAAAARAGLAKSIFRSGVQIGPIFTQGETGVAPVVIDGRADGDRRITWYERDIAPGVDGVISIAHLPYESVTLNLRPAAQDEVPIVLETSPEGTADAAYIHKVGGKEIEVRFLLDTPRSMLSAAAGALLAEHHGGAWSGEAFDQPIALGVSRPVRPMRFSRPIVLGGLPVDQMLVRTSDYRGKYVLPSSTIDASEDASQIVVTGKRAKSRAALNAIIGNDYLSRCSSITYSRNKRLLTMRCKPGPA